MGVVIDINIGRLIKKVILEKKVSQAELARLLKTSPTQITRLLNKNSIGTDLLCEISNKLNYNFFSDFEDLEHDDTVKTVIEQQIKPRGFYLTYPHIGHQIIKRMKEIKVSQTELGIFLGISQDVVSRTLKNNSIDTGRLFKISSFLNYNFFGCFYGLTFEDDISIANKTDGILVRYVKDLNNMDGTITELMSDNDVMKEYGKNIRNMVNLINILYKENELLKSKLKSK